MDDDRDTADSLATLLSLHGYAATPAYSAEHALRLAAASPPEAVVCDVWMATDGCDLARDLLASLSPRPLLVAVTGAPGQVERCRAAGFDHVLLKPAEPSALVNLLTAGVPRG